MKTIILKRFPFFLLLVLAALAGGSCSWKYLKVENAGPATGINGSYTVFLYGGRYMEDYETVAVMAEENTPYTFEIYAPEFNYKVKKGIAADKAFSMAKKFVSFNHEFYTTNLSKILDTHGNTIGYEMRPLYYPFYLRYSDVLDVAYRIEGKKVTVYIKLKPEVEKTLNNGGDRNNSSIH